MMSDVADFELSDTTSDEEEDITYRSPVTGMTPTSAMPFIVPKVGRKGGIGQQARKSHRHTASIASLIRGDERGADDGWRSPVTGAGFVFPPTPTKGERGPPTPTR